MGFDPKEGNPDALLKWSEHQILMRQIVMTDINTKALDLTTQHCFFCQHDVETSS